MTEWDNTKTMGPLSVKPLEVLKRKLKRYAGGDYIVGVNLKPCPFCGAPGEASLHPGLFYYTIGCSDHDCIGSELWKTWDDDDESLREGVEAWNKRE